jgi:hypothetical protein
MATSSRIARLGVMRLGRARLNYHQPWIKLLVNGVNRSGKGRIQGCTITDELNHEPNNATLRVQGFTPLKGQEVKIYMGDTDVAHQLFGGHILQVTSVYESKRTNLAWDLHCIDYTWLLNRRKVIKKYTNLSATAIVQDLIATYAAGFTTVGVSAGMGVIDEITFTNDELTDAITRVMERVGGYWYPDYGKDIKAFQTDTEFAGAITDTVARTAIDLSQHIDLSQLATRVTARGGGANAAADVAVGGTTIPVEDAAYYAGAGGTVECGPQRIGYTGVAGTGETGSATGYTAPPPGLTLIGGSGGTLTAGATYLVAGTFVTPEGETNGITASVTLGGAQNEILWSNFAVSADPKVTLKRIYVSDANAGAATLKKYSDVAIGTTSGIIAGVGVGAIPTQNTAGFSSIATPAGSTSLQVEDLAQFAAAGWASGPGDQAFRYTGRSATTGPGTLTGIPASGVGSLTAAVRAGTVKSVPHLTGVTGILYAINKGDPVNIVVTVNDVAAQTAMAGFVGGDGIHEYFITDGRWSITEATARANAELTQRKDPLITVSFNSRDQTIVSGRSLSITLTSPAITGTFKIQRVTMTNVGVAGGGPHAQVFPTRAVELSSHRYSFEDLLRQIKKKAA